MPPLRRCGITSLSGRFYVIADYAPKRRAVNFVVIGLREKNLRSVEVTYMSRSIVLHTLRSDWSARVTKCRIVIQSEVKKLLFIIFLEIFYLELPS